MHNKLSKYDISSQPITKNSKTVLLLFTNIVMIMLTCMHVITSCDLTAAPSRIQLICSFQFLTRQRLHRKDTLKLPTFSLFPCSYCDSLCIVCVGTTCAGSGGNMKVLLACIRLCAHCNSKQLGYCNLYNTKKLLYQLQYPVIKMIFLDSMFVIPAWIQILCLESAALYIKQQFA